MKRIILIILVLLPIFFIKIPKYKELNQIKIITSINIDCNNIVHLKEIIPIKDNNGIDYKYKIYKYNSLTEVLKDKNLYLKKTKKIIIKCSNKEKKN